VDSKLLVRAAAAAFVGVAVAMTLVQLREEPAARQAAATDPLRAEGDPLADQLRVCAEIGEAALSAPECRAAWAEKRRRFLGVAYPGAYAALIDPSRQHAEEPVLPHATGKQRGDD
jgi:conjugative transfer region protein TrbK